MNTEIQKLRSIFEDLSNKYKFSCHCLEIVISDRLRSSNGQCEWRKDVFGFIFARITMSKPLLDEFGWERFEKSFRHEVAHIADAYGRNKSRHDMHFKIICQKFGGSMNSKMAGNIFSDCASTEYIQPIRKWKYQCSCGNHFLRTKKMNADVRSRTICGICRLSMTKWEEIQLT